MGIDVVGFNVCEGCPYILPAILHLLVNLRFVLENSL